jgi:hypothetical protein
MVTTQQELICRIQSLLKKFDSNFLQNLMGGVKTKLRAIADKGVLAPYILVFKCVYVFKSYVHFIFNFFRF